MKYAVRFSEEARGHLRGLSARERQTVLDRVRTVLGDQPTRETRNLKVLRPNPVAKFELRIGALRVFFEINGGGREVFVLAIGRKEGNRLRIGGKEVKL
jgi:mRNA-degrading endonuclease RelE of RelBE toxin-antitoxin system